MRRSSLLRLAAAAVVPTVACGTNLSRPDAATPAQFPETPPFTASSATAQRQILVHVEPAVSAAGLADGCTAEAMLFDPPSAPAAVQPVAAAGGCTAYAAAADPALAGASWVCAGAISLRGARGSESLVVCPDLAPIRTDPFRGVRVPLDCANFAAGDSITMRSDNETGSDRVEDLLGTVALPPAFTLTGPAPLGVASWPASGDLAVTWSPASASSARVVLETRSDPVRGARIVCNATANAQLTVPASVIDAVGLRAQDVVVSVEAFNRTTVTAESGKSYALHAGTRMRALLQRRN